MVPPENIKQNCTFKWVKEMLDLKGYSAKYEG